jgi:hypothetical protein
MWAMGTQAISSKILGRLTLEFSGSKAGKEWGELEGDFGPRLRDRHFPKNLLVLFSVSICAASNVANTRQRRTG